MKYLLSIVFTPLLLLASTTEINAQVVINEVNPNGTGSSEADEFIELYNKGTTAETITGWTISDTTGSTKNYTIPEKTLGVGEFVSFRRSVTDIVLNNDGDGVVLKDSGNTTKNEIVVGSYSNKENFSYSRIPDGSDNFVDYTELSEGMPNIAPPTPTPTVPPIDTPTPTNAPTATPTTTPTKAPTPKPTVRPTVKPSASPTDSGIVLSDSVTAPPTSSPKVVAAESGSKVPVIAFVLIGLGLISIGGAFYPFLKSKLKAYNGNNAQDN